MGGPCSRRALPRNQLAHIRQPSSLELAEPARLALLVLLATALLGGCGLVAAIAAHASAADAIPGAAGALRLGQTEGAPRHADALGAPRRAAGGAAAAGAAAEAQMRLPGGGARADPLQRRGDLGSAAAAEAAAGELGRELPANRAQAVLQPLVFPDGSAARDVPDSHTRPAGRARAAAKRAARAAAAAAAGGPGFAGGAGRAAGPQRGSAYLALCAIMKDQNAEVREWVEHHARLGVGKFYITDTGSAEPLGRQIRDHIASGLVDYFYSEDLMEAVEYPQLYVYDVCLHKFGGRHEWMGFIDADEFLVLPGGGPSLPALLRGYEEYAALGVNMRTFGSSGHVARPSGSTLHNYIKCTNGSDEHTRHIKTLAHTRTGLVLGAENPHSFEYEDGAFAVNEHGERIEDYLTDEASWEHIVLNHYVLKSREEFAAKVARSNGMNDPKPASYFDEIDALATEDCTYAADLYPAVQD